MINKNKIKKILIPISSIVLYCCFFSIVLAADTEYILLEELPVIGTSVSGIGSYLVGMFKLSIGLATVLAVLQLSVGGFEYLTTEAFTGKSDAKKRITNAIFGLILILSSYLILKTINPDFVEQDLIIPRVGNLEDGWKEGGSGTSSNTDNAPNIIYLKQISPIGESPSCTQPTVTNNNVLYNYVEYDSNNYECHTSDMTEQDKQRGCCRYEKS